MATKKKKALPKGDIESIISGVSGKITNRLEKAPRFSFPEYGFRIKTGMKKPCEWDYDRAPPKARIEFETVTDDGAAKLGVKPGPALRLCFGVDQPGVLVNVSTPKEAVEIGKNFRDCSSGEKSAKSCALDTAKDLKLNYKIAGVKRTSRRGRR